MAPFDPSRLRHALRTPLNHILGYSEILRDEAEDAGDTAAIDCLDRIRSSVRRILEGLQTQFASAMSPAGAPSLDTLRRALLPDIEEILAAVGSLRGNLGGLSPDDLGRIESAARSLLEFANGGHLREAAASSTAAEPAEPPYLAGARVLVVDDDEANRAILLRVLEREGFQVRSAAGGKQALGILRRESFDIVLLDLFMPGMDGFEVLDALQADGRLRSLPVIVLSASDELANVVRSIERGAEDFVPKPFDPLLLRVRIGASLRRKRAEQERAELAESLRLLLESTGEGIYGLDRAGHCTFMNEAALRLLGYTRAEVLAQPVQRLIHHSLADGAVPAAGESPVLQVLRTGEPLRIDDGRMLRSDGTTIPVQYSAHAILQDREVRGAVVVFSDISQRKREEERLRESAKLESLGVLAGGLAHDFNNLLTGIMGNTSLVLDELPPQDPNALLLGEVIRASEKAADLTRQMLAYAGKGRYMPCPIDLTEIVTGMSDLLHASIAKKARLMLRLTAGLPPVLADPGQMQQLILNLVLNAGEAIGDWPGCVAIETGVVHLQEALTGEPAFGEVTPGTYICVAVEDTGCGMDAATRSRIFEPFFSTKFTGRGLGLPAVLGIVRSHSGTVRLATAPGRGSRFEILLPAHVEVALPKKTTNAS